ncbi:MAG: DNA repair protein RadC [Muribaculaceae bacterium]|nr:DNA repair protein RadC [Muribaculaceae bacterium]MDE6832298.1 DNA repair protein RadC [Muribaculaceae bacterium]
MSDDVNTLKVADLDDGDKPREKALTSGIGSLSNAELMAIILGSGMPGKSVISLSQEILRDADGRISRIARLSLAEMMKKYRGVGPAKAVSLAAAFELGVRCADDMAICDMAIGSGADIYKLMRGKLQRLNNEEFWVVHLSRANRVLSQDCISRGGTSATVVDVKLILKSAIDKLSSAIILVHNHPSGNLRPSGQDDNITSRIKKGAELLDIRVLDHIIISPEGYYSYNDEGRL